MILSTLGGNISLQKLKLTPMNLKFMLCYPYIAPPLFTRLHRLVRKATLGESWASVWSNYRDVVLEQSQVQWIIKAKNRNRNKAIDSCRRQ